jgi:hypothetical protein
MGGGIATSPNPASGDSKAFFLPNIVHSLMNYFSGKDEWMDRLL